jgi:hypothetical protein
VPEMRDQHGRHGDSPALVLFRLHPHKKLLIHGAKAAHRTVRLADSLGLSTSAIQGMAYHSYAQTAHYSRTVCLGCSASSTLSRGWRYGGPSDVRIFDSLGIGSHRPPRAGAGSVRRVARVVVAGREWTKLSAGIGDVLAVNESVTVGTLACLPSSSRSCGTTLSPRALAGACCPLLPTQATCRIAANFR